MSNAELILRLVEMLLEQKDKIADAESKNDKD